jgi:DNA polymerase I-like protein with 3'-5' exonuclease and polymerase domains
VRVYDIVYSAWKHAAVHKRTGCVVANALEYKDGGGINMLISILILQAEVLLTEEQGVRDRRRWRNLWKEIYAWQEVGINQWRQKRPGSTPLGRKYMAKMMTDQLNIENQGAGAEVAKLALHYFYPKMKAYNAEHGTDFMLCNFIHDSLITEGPDKPEHYQAIALMKAEAMQKAWFEMSVLYKIKDLPMPVDVKVGTNWGDIEDDDIEDIWSTTLEGMHYAPV